MIGMNEVFRDIDREVAALEAAVAASAVAGHAPERFQERLDDIQRTLSRLDAYVFNANETIQNAGQIFGQNYAGHEIFDNPIIDALFAKAFSFQEQSKGLATRLDGLRARCFSLHGDACAKAGRLDLAPPAWKESLRWRPDNAKLARTVAAALAETLDPVIKDPELILERLEDCLAHDPAIMRRMPSPASIERAHGAPLAAALRELASHYALRPRVIRVIRYAPTLYPAQAARFDFDPEGGLYILDVQRQTIHCLDANGGFRGYVSGPGAAPGRLQQPFDLKYGNGRLLVAEIGANRLQFLPIRPETAEPVDPAAVGQAEINGPDADDSRREPPIVVDRDPLSGQVFAGGLIEVEKRLDGGFFALDARDRRVYDFDSSLTCVASFTLDLPFVPMHPSRLSTLHWSETTKRLYLSTHHGRVYTLDAAGRLLAETEARVFGARPGNVKMAAPFDGGLLLWDKQRNALLKWKEGRRVACIDLGQALPELAAPIAQCRFNAYDGKFYLLDATFTVYELALENAAV